MIDKGYLPHEWIIFYEKHLSRKDAFQKEQSLIKELRPIYNRKSGPKKKLSDEQIRQTKELRSRQLSYDKIAILIGCSRETVYRVITNKRGTY